MTAFSAPLRLHADVAAREDDAAVRVPRWVRNLRDGKLRRMAALESLRGCREPDLLALGAVADLTFPAAGEVLAEGYELARFWWMPVEGWLLVGSDRRQAITIPAGWSWTAGQDPAATLTTLRPGAVLVAPIGSLQRCLEDRPRLAESIRSSLVGGHV